MNPETSASVTFDTHSNWVGGWTSETFAGNTFHEGWTEAAGTGATYASSYLMGTGFMFYAIILLGVLLTIAIWRRLTREAGS